MGTHQLRREMGRRAGGQRVAGVNAIADDIEVKLPDSQRRTDGEIATSGSISNQLFHDVSIWNRLGDSPRRLINAGGRSRVWYRKDAAEKAVLHLGGVRGLLIRS